MTIHKGDVFSSNTCGDFIVVNCDKMTKVLIRFIDTGTEITTRKCHVLSGGVKDKLFPFLCGVGFIGYGIYTAKSRAYSCWSNMIRRCYSDNYHAKKPAYKTCETCEEWQNFQVFALWYEENHPKDGLDYDLDKDYLVKGNKLYSPSTCCFLSRSENSRIAGERFCASFEVISPLGVIHKGHNQTLFARGHGLSQTVFGRMLNGKQPAHKGWTLA